jgi:hypothetical protein
MEEYTIDINEIKTYHRSSLLTYTVIHSKMSALTIKTGGWINERIVKRTGRGAAKAEYAW